MRRILFAMDGRRLTLLLIETSVLMAGMAAVLIVGLPVLRMGS